jgi:hypothetical protein
VLDKDLGECLRRNLVDYWVMWTPHLPCLSPDMSEEIRLKKLLAAKKMLKKSQHRNSPGVPVRAKIKKKIKKWW